MYALIFHYSHQGLEHMPYALNRSSTKNTHALLTLGLVFVFWASSAVFAATVAGINVPERQKVNEVDLVLSGAGVRHALGGLVKVYVGALYVPQKRASFEEIASQKGPKRMNIMMLREANANEFAKGLMAGMRDNVNPTEQQKHFTNFVKLGELYGKLAILVKGDIVSLDFVPGTGTTLTLNGKRVGDAFTDESFWPVLMQVWFGPKPVDASLKPALLGAAAKQERASAERY
jgi:hypothetical protein